MDSINQKEYLKKYLGIGRAPGEKKKKKKVKGVLDRVKIIDDDADAGFPNTFIEEDPLHANEYAPQIVAIIDERPPSLRVDDKTKNPLWQPIGSANNTNGATGQKQMITGFKINKLPPKPTDVTDRSPPRRKKRIIGDNSPPRKSRSEGNSPRKYKQEDNSPQRKYGHEDNSPQRKNSHEDNSPLRNSGSNGNSPITNPRSDDNSPPRKNRQSDDYSPPRKNRQTDDYSPPRKSRPTDDYSPPRKNRKTDNYSPPRRNKRTFTRKSRTPDTSPPRKQKKTVSKKSERNRSPSSQEDRKKHRTEEKRSGKIERTLDGKAAGLQDAQQLAEETKIFRAREDQLFKNLPKDLSGENAETILRDRKTGKVRNLQEEEERQRKKLEEEEKNKEKYSRWGRGLVQVENRDQQIKEELYEMSKPLARYADDEDLEKYLKEQEREGDPMLAYIRSKKRKKAAKSGEVIKPQFEGQFMPNRYGIKPGHRWDGVDRSNGYEKKWFEVQNAKRAQQEDTYKWSTEDM